MKVCIVAACNVFSDFSGAPKRVFSLAKGLSDRGASVNVLHQGPSKSLASNFKFFNFHFFELGDGSSNYLHPFNLSFVTQLKHFLAKYPADIIQCESPWSVFPTVFLSRNLRIPYVLDEHNVEFLWSLHASRMPFLAPATFVLEQIAAVDASLILTTSEMDKKLIMSIFNIKKEKLAIVPNGVDTSRFSRISIPQSQLRTKLGLAQKKRIVIFHGTMSVRQNYEAAQLIISLIAPKIDAHFIIVGIDAPQWLKANAEGHKNVQLIGYVPNIEEYIMASDLCIVPICRGSGTRLKILEYLAAGKPIVSTVVGAEGLPIKSGVSATLCEKVDGSFNDSIRNLLENASEAKEMGAAGKKIAEKFDWNNVTKHLFNLYLLNFG